MPTTVHAGCSPEKPRGYVPRGASRASAWKNALGEAPNARSLISSSARPYARAGPSCSASRMKRVSASGSASASGPPWPPIDPAHRAPSLAVVGELDVVARRARASRQRTIRPPNSRGRRKSTVSVCAGPRRGRCCQAVAVDRRRAPARPRRRAARTTPAPRAAARAGLGGGSSRSAARSRTPIRWPPPRPAATTNSMRRPHAAASRSAVGPHANSTWRFLIRTCCHSRGKSKLGRLTHQTLSPLASTSLTWKC